MKINEFYSGMDIMKYDYLTTFHKTLIKRFIKGFTRKELQQKVESYNQSFLKSKGMYLFYDDLTIKPITDSKYYLLLNGNEFYYYIDSNNLEAI